MQKHIENKKKKLKINFDMIQSDKEFYLQNCNFNEIQEKVFEDLTGKESMSIIQIAMKENISDRTVCRVIRKIKIKMLQAILSK